MKKAFFAMPEVARQEANFLLIGKAGFPEGSFGRSGACLSISALF